MNERGAGIIFLSLGALVLAVAGFVTYESLSEAYGAGAPYYSRTTNMDKWSDPLPELLIGDSVAIIVAVFLWRLGRRRLQSHKR